ncbi:MAG: UDP-3-O-(3-hydroxymyristoyl)glucosamine N-acyltransferase [Sinomicrobium sp.]|nr:UDP-3-O-(3-hydroxymyristoyl)glucosamine N-acyltransferase [Sinomicrobium sp.]
MKFTAAQIAEILKGDIEGDPDIEVSKLSRIESGEKGSLTFLANPKYTGHLYSTAASVVIVAKNFKLEGHPRATLIKVDDAYKSFSRLLEYYDNVKMNKTGIEEPVFIASSATCKTNVYIGAFTYIGNCTAIGENVKIYPNTYIGDNVTIGDNTVIYAGAKINSETVIGDHCIIHSGVVIGADGFGFSPDEHGEYKKIPQTGNVILEDFVEVGAGTTIDRATLGSTLIKKGVKLDNLIQIAHNVEIGENTVIAAQTGIAGSTKIGKNCMIGGQVGIVGHISIGNNVKIQAQSGVIRNIEDGEILQGSPALNYGDYNKSYVHFKNLPKIVDIVDKLKKSNPNE